MDFGPKDGSDANALAVSESRDPRARAPYLIWHRMAAAGRDLGGEIGSAIAGCTVQVSHLAIFH